MSAASVKLVTGVVDAIENGAVPVARVEVICPLALSVVNAPVEGVVPPIGVPFIEPPVIAAFDEAK